MKNKVTFDKENFYYLAKHDTLIMLIYRKSYKEKNQKSLKSLVNKYIFVDILILQTEKIYTYITEMTFI